MSAPAKPRAKSAKAAAKEAASAADAGSADGPLIVSSFVDHMKTKGMWAGALERVMIPDLLGAIPIPINVVAESGASSDDESDTESVAASVVSATASAASASTSITEVADVQLIEIVHPHTPALMKGIDEIVVNATDCRGRGVTKIDISFDISTGRITVRNDGLGVPVNLHEAQSAVMGRPVYVPEIAFGIPLAGTNIEKAHTSVKGGTNGIGAKLTNVHSLEFAIETVDGVTKQRYTQVWRNRMSEVGMPVITAANRCTDLRGVKPYTQVSFVLAFAALGYPTAVKGAAAAQASHFTSADDATELDAWLRLRSYQAAAYMGPKVQVSYNGLRCNAADAAGLARIIAATQKTNLVLSSTARATIEPWSLHPWSIAVIIPTESKVRGRKSAASSTMAVVNGVMSNKGTHVQYLRGLIAESVNARLKIAGAPPAGAAEALAGVRLVMVGAIPGAEWSGQRKDELQVNAKDTVNWPTPPAAYMKRVGEAIAMYLLKGTSSAPQRAVVHEKYTPARFAGKAQRAHTYLLAAEGDSAITLLRAGLTQQRGVSIVGGPSLDWCGIISLQGVIVNAMREVTQLKTDGADVAVRSARLRDNKRLAALADAFGLRYDYQYETEAELTSLRYGKLVLCVDQDLDGTGKIAALVLVWIHEFWPALLRNGRVGRLMTPLVRAYARNARGPAGSSAGPAAAEFFYEEELHAWLHGDPSLADSHTIKYYKGLATHDSTEVKRMFTPEQFAKCMYTYKVEDAAATARLFTVYFGADPALRKAVLVTPVRHLDVAGARELHAARTIPVGRVQLDIDTKSYKNDAIKRQIPSAVDSLNPARRKIIVGAFMRFAGEAAARELKVFQLGGFVADKMFYHHGDASLNSTIIYMAQAFAGARRFPLLEGVGQFGSRHGDKAGSARYISVRLGAIARAIFPPVDRWHLPYVFEDGARAEPQWLAPVAPLAALESGSNISEGWNHDSYGRDVKSVMRVVEAYISGDADLHQAATRISEAFSIGGGALPTDLVEELRRLTLVWQLPVSTAGFTGRVVDYRGSPHSFGSYTYTPETRTVTVTDLPLGEATNKFIERLQAMTGEKPAAKASAAKTAKASTAKASAAKASAAKTAKVSATKSATKDAPTKAALIESVRDCSTSDSVRIEVVLATGVYEMVTSAESKYGDAVIDPVEDLLALRVSLRPHLNYYSARGGVLELPNETAGYLAAILYWAPLRASIYKARITRELVVAELRALEEEQTLKYIGEAAQLDLAALPDSAAAVEVLRRRGYLALDTPLLHRPEYTPNDELREKVTRGANASYDYILDLRERELVKNATAARRVRLESLRKDATIAAARLAEKPVAAASVWRTELAELNVALALALAPANRYTDLPGRGGK